jgi:hypothetical protein
MAKAVGSERKTHTELQRSRRACARHLKDLKRAHCKPPTDVAIKPTAQPKRLAAPPESSFCTSPSALCAELMS